jgi:branched-chain amino acid transport system permease protein
VDFFVLNTLNAVSYGAILFLLASGFSLVFGVMGVLNLSHGALYMVGAYVGWTIAVKNGLNFWLGALAGGLVAGLISLVMEAGFFRRLYQQLNEQMLLTFGFVYILDNLARWIWGPLYKAPFTAPALSGSFSIMGSMYPKVRIAIILIGIIIAIGLWWLQDKTRAGAMIRAGMDDKEIAMALGINLPLVATLTFFLGSFIAGFAGVTGAQLLGVYPEMSISVMLLVLAVIIIGGVGSVQGTLIGAGILGIIDAFGKALFPDYAMFTIYLAMIVVLLIKPSGILGRQVS